jgi:hypothetical protein
MDKEFYSALWGFVGGQQLSVKEASELRNINTVPPAWTHMAQDRDR